MQLWLAEELAEANSPAYLSMVALQPHLADNGTCAIIRPLLLGPLIDEITERLVK